MSISGKLLKKREKTLIIVFEDNGFRTVIADTCSVSAVHNFPGVKELKDILIFGKKQNVRNVLCLQNTDIRELDVKLGSDLSSDERRTAVEYAAAGSLSDHSGSVRVSFAEAGGLETKNGIAASCFDTEDILALARAVKNMKMKFLGAVNCKQLLLAHHFTDPLRKDGAFLFLLDGHSIAAAEERKKIIIRNLPSGIPEAGGEEEWLERVQRRLNNIFRSKRVFLYAPPADEKLCAALKDISEADFIETVNWDEAIGSAAAAFLRKRGDLLHPALPPPKEKDPKASGTYIGMFFLAVTVLTLGFLITRNIITGHIFMKDIASAQEKIDIVKKETDALNALERQLAQQQETVSVMKQRSRASEDYILVLNLLSRYPLQYSRITAITEKENGIHIEGESIWQPDLSGFFVHFEGELSKYELTLFSDSLSKEEDGRILFRTHVAPAERGK